ncbi:MAG TPA: GIY-YIG nuclease family protein [Verrucomicrobiae bacterium]|jgi:group I intron endonuclease
MLGIIENPFGNRLLIDFKCRGIYGIRHNASEKIYVGSSKNVCSRIYQHLRALRAKRHHSRHFQRAWNKHGQEAFTVLLLEKVLETKMLAEREQFWMDYFRAFTKTFNSAPRAESTRDYKWTESQKNKIRGYRRGVWTADTRKRVSEALKQRHAKNPEWRKNAQTWLHSPKNEAKRIAAFTAALKLPKNRNRLVQHLDTIRKKPARVTGLRKAYFEKFNRQSLGFQNPEEMDQACVKLFLEGKSCREIGKLFCIGHHAISDRLRRLGFSPSRIRHVGFASPKEMTQACIKLHLEGKSRSAIGRILGMDGRAILSRLQRAGINPTKFRRHKHISISASIVETK